MTLPTCPCGAPATVFRPGDAHDGTPTTGRCDALACWPPAELLVVRAFGRYASGAVITEASEIEVVLASRPECVVGFVDENTAGSAHTKRTRPHPSMPVGPARTTGA